MRLVSLKTMMLVVALVLLVYVAYAGKGTTAGPLLGIALTGKALSERKNRLAELKGLIRERETQVNEIFANTEREFNEKKRAKLLETPEEAKRCADLQRERDAFIEEHNNLDALLRERGDEVPFDAPAAVRNAAGRSLGDQFVNDSAVREWRGPENNPRQLSNNVAFQSPHVNVETFFPSRQRGLVTAGSVTSAGAMIVPQRVPGVDAGWMRPLTIRDLITMGETGSNLVEYVRETFTNNADTASEASGVNDGSGALPQSDIAFELVQEPVKEIGHWIAATTQALMDAAQTRTEIDTALLQGIEEKLEDQIVSGDGVGSNFKGILSQTGLSTQAFSNDIFETSRKAKTKVATLGKARPTAFVFNPTVMEAIDLEKNLTGGFYAAGAPFGTAPPTLWGLPRIESQSPGVTTYGLVADWRLAVLYDRMRSEIFVANQHGDFAIRLMAAIIAVYRAAFAVKRPAAFCRIATS